ncbi:MAG: hypothetical protein LBN33_05685, partial [Desulfovibrio sp.]|nr:hypothetical protein [Desulfovibrio sp.]
MAGFYKTPAAKAVLFFCIVLFLSAGSADAAETLLKPGAAELKKMSTFLSNFTEIGLDNFYVKGSGVDGSGDLLALSADDPADLVRFGIWHNYRNNYDSRVAPCKAKGCKWGSLTIDGKHVLESVKKYFDIDLKNRSITESDPPYYYDGKLYHFEGADGEATY